MPRPNPYAKLNVLVCDGRLSQSQSVRDRYGGSYHPQALSVVDILDRLTGNKIHITRVDEIDDVVQKMKSHDTTHYALVVYASYHITNKSGGMKIQKVKDIDPFLPQVIYGQEITGDNLEKGYRRGIRYTARNIESLEETLGKIFWAPKDPLKNLAVVKVGGSSFDFEDENEESPNLGYVVEALLRIKNKIPENIGIPKHLTTPKQQIIEAVGAGQFGSKLLRHIKKYPETKKATPELIARALDTNLRLVNEL
ncbi:hypothetical protein HYT53_00745 [Candidatus Woesearchaeota archaeon]|nr:hypothetical protein [Candidatus Woesearchaeota archaeon]